MQLNVGANVKEHELIEARKRLEDATPARRKESQISKLKSDLDLLELAMKFKYFSMDKKERC